MLVLNPLGAWGVLLVYNLLNLVGDKFVYVYLSVIRKPWENELKFMVSNIIHANEDKLQNPNDMTHIHISAYQGSTTSA